MDKPWNKLYILFFGAVLISLVDYIQSKPSLSRPASQSFRALPSFPYFPDFFNRNKETTTTPSPMKAYSGQRTTSDSLIMIYHHDLTVAIVELGPDKIIYGCELIEIYYDEEGAQLLKQLSRINRPFEITFQQMSKLMSQCELVDRRTRTVRSNTDTTSDAADSAAAAADKDNTNSTAKPPTLFSGFQFQLPKTWPGTKWCGSGDAASNFHDLGNEYEMDMCCRTHDHCPKKVRAYRDRYNITNNSLYSKSHCTCDDMLHRCLRAVNTTASQTVGNIYFNLVQVPCLQDNSDGTYSFRAAREY